MIDEADHPESFPFEASNHVAGCPDCGSFAQERARLRSLLVLGSRVTVPTNFDAVLRSKLAEANARKGYAWLSPVGYLRLGGATAALIVMVFGAQYAGFFGSDNPRRDQQIADVVKPQGTVPEVAVQPPVISSGKDPRAITVSSGTFPRRNRYSERASGPGVPVEIPREDYFHEDGGVMLVRGSNGEGEVSLPMVSVGAQSLVYSSANAGRRNARNIGTSF
jgi:hypothetical protein